MSVQQYPVFFFFFLSAGNDVQYLGMTAGVRSLAGGLLALIPPLSRMSLSVLTMRLVAMVGERERKEDAENVCLNIWGVFLDLLQFSDETFCCLFPGRGIQQSWPYPFWT